MFDERIQDLWVVNPIITGKKVLFYGAGEEVYQLYKSLVRPGIIDLIGVYDNGNPNGEGSMWGNVKMLSRQQMLDLDRSTVVIISTKVIETYQEIAKDLMDNGFVTIISRLWPAVPKQYDIELSKELIARDQRKIDRLYELLEDENSIEVVDGLLKYRTTNDVKMICKIREQRYKQYFPTEKFFEPEEDELFIDAGALDGSTVRDFVVWSGGKYKKAYAFEPSREDKIIVDEMIKHWGYNVESVAAGLYNKNGTVSFSALDMGWSTITEDGNESIDVVKLDDFMKDKNERVSFIKMDIEGSEMEALEGALATIGKDHPKLAICIYHKFDDLWNIPLWIHEKFPKYKFYIRHHSITDNETVMYAVWQD